MKVGKNNHLLVVTALVVALVVSVFAVVVEVVVVARRVRKNNLRFGARWQMAAKETELEFISMVCIALQEKPCGRSQLHRSMNVRRMHCDGPSATKLHTPHTPRPNFHFPL